MADKNSLIELSRTEWIPTDAEGKTRRATDEELQTGCLQRIANAVEKMAKPFTDLMQENERLKRDFEFQLNQTRDLRKSIPYMRGQVTKYKNQNQVLRAELAALAKMQE